MSGPGLALASRVACRSEPGPLSRVRDEEAGQQRPVFHEFEAGSKRKGESAESGVRLASSSPTNAVKGQAAIARGTAKNDHRAPSRGPDAIPSSAYDCRSFEGVTCRTGHGRPCTGRLDASQSTAEHGQRRIGLDDIAPNKTRWAAGVPAGTWRSI